MMNKNWKRKTVTAMVAMALMMQQVGASNVASAKENVDVGYIEQEMEIKEGFHGYDDLDEWEDEDNWEDADESEDDTEDDYTATFYMDDLEDDEDDTDEEDGWKDVDESEDDTDEEEDWIEPSMAVSSLTLKAGKSSKIAIDGDWEEVVWKSSKNSVVKVDDNGKVTGIKAGKATITAIVYYYKNTNEWVDVDDELDDYDMDEDESDDYDMDEDSELAVKFLKCTVKVTAAPLKISAKKVNLKAGKSKVLKVIGATGKVTWKTNNKKVAKVVNGKVTALKAGNAKITARTGGKTFVCKVVVKKK